MKRLFLGLALFATGCQAPELWMGPAFFALPTQSIVEANTRSAADVQITAGGPFQLTLKSYQLQYFGEDGKPIDSLATSEAVLEPAIGIGGATPKATVYVPVVSPAVQAYGSTGKHQAMILCRVTFKGTTGEEILASVPIRFNHP